MRLSEIILKAFLKMNVLRTNEKIVYYVLFVTTSCILICPVYSAFGAQTNWVDWISASTGNPGAAEGTAALADSRVVSVNYSGEIFFAQISGGTNYWDPPTPYVSATVDNPPPTSDIIALVGGNATVNTITFSEPVENPVMAIVSLGQASIQVIYQFDAPFDVLSNGPGPWGNGSFTELPGNVLEGVEGNGVIQFTGSFTSISWTAPNAEGWHGFTIGIPVSDLSPSGFSFDVDSTRGWQTTTLKVTAGQQLSFSAVGSWSVDHRNNFSFVGPEGYSPEEDSTIFQDCKLDPSLPYGQLLVRVGDDPSFQAIGSEGALTADHDGFLAFRIHDADACLVDNAGTVTVTVTGGSAVARTPFFYCITGPGQGGGCLDVYKNPVPDTNLPSPPEWLTSPLAAECLIAVTGDIVDKVHPGLGKLADAIDIAGFYETFYSLAQERGIPLEGAQTNPLYWRTLVDALVQNQILDELKLQNCRDWAATLP